MFRRTSVIDHWSVADDCIRSTVIVPYVPFFPTVLYYCYACFENKAKICTSSLRLLWTQTVQTFRLLCAKPVTGLCALVYTVWLAGLYVFTVRIYVWKINNTMWHAHINIVTCYTFMRGWDPYRWCKAKQDGTVCTELVDCRGIRYYIFCTSASKRQNLKLKHGIG